MIIYGYKNLPALFNKKFFKLMLILAYVLISLTILFVIGYLFFLILSVVTSFSVKVPFVPIRRNILSAIVETLAINQDAVVYDLGCGDGRVLMACYAKEPRASYVGLEKQLMPVWFAKWQTRKTPIKILQKDFFKYNLADATCVFVYLSPSLMDELLPKFKQELRPGTRLISCDYQFSNKQAIKTIDLKQTYGKLGKFLYVYKF